jgi:anthranilate synthase/aminodeoxychorismate synthase-like glutamine amidotransferase
MIDNYDSFTFNLVHYFQALGQEVVVYRNDEISIDGIKQLAPQYIVISPGPCDPNSAGLSLEVIKNFAGKTPLLGVCLGHQCIAQYYGAIV